MSNPNETAMYLPRPYPTALTPQWKKYIIQGATPNDTRLDFNMDQKSLIPRSDVDSYAFTAYPRPNTGIHDHDIDLEFMTLVSPKFPIWIEKIKLCLHQHTTYGCVKVNVWDFGDAITNIPTNLVGVNCGEDADENIPLTIYENNKLISNALADPDLYMIESGQTTYLDPFDYTIAANSILRYGIQYAEGNAYGLKIFIIGWMLECDTTEEEEEVEEEEELEPPFPGAPGDFQLSNTGVSLTSSWDLNTYHIPNGIKGYSLVNSNSTRDEYEVEDEVGGKTYKMVLWIYKNGQENQMIARLYVTESQFSEVWYTLTPAGQVTGTHNESLTVNCTSLSPTIILS